MRALLVVSLGCVGLLACGGLALAPAQARLGNDASKADAERAVQAYLALWSRDDGINPASITRFYAPHVVYYGKAMSRAEVLADKRAYIRVWPQRRYWEVPGTFTASCTPGLGRCDVSTTMAWRRVARDGRVSTGRARLNFEFVPSDGARKIAREGARIL